MLPVTPVTHLTGGRSRSRGQKPGRPPIVTLLFEASALVLLCPLPVSQTSHRERSALCLWAVARRGASSPHASRPEQRRPSDTFRLKPPRRPLPASSKVRAARKKQKRPGAAAKGCADYLPTALPVSHSPSNIRYQYHKLKSQSREGSENGCAGGAMQLDELERKLADEVKVRNRAERRLRRAIRKLESLKVLDVGLSDGSTGSLYSNGRSGHQAPEAEVGAEAEERNGPGSLTTDGSAPSAPSGDADRVVSSEGSCTQLNSSSQDGSWCSVASEQSQPGPCMDPAGHTTNCRSAGSGGCDRDSERQHLDASSRGCGPAKPEEAVNESDDTLALVLVDPQLVAAAAGGGPRTQAGEVRRGRSHEEEEEEESDRLAIVLAEPQRQAAAGRGDVESVLLALRRVKEQLRYTIERRSRARLVVAHQELYGH
uniref:Uncharacterized protein n=1 Tax=Zea mays TaxID=4577 RepID=A0A804R865_MAIZE